MTGRPRADAERFVERFGLCEVVDALIAREDAAALKPDPAPVRAALRALNVERAWMVGDTPDDVVAARAAAVLPIGCLPPGCGAPDELRASLHEAGAGFVLNETTEIEELLP